MTPLEQIRKLAPKGAVSYRLLSYLSDGVCSILPSPQTVYPLSGTPPSLAPGNYDIIYFSISNQLLDRLGVALVVGPGSQVAPAQQALSVAHPMKAAAASAAIRPVIKPVIVTGTTTERSEGEAAASDPNSEATASDESHDDRKRRKLARRGWHRAVAARARDDVEARQENHELEMARFQLEVQERNAQMLKDNLSTKEMAEAFQLNSVYRQEVVDATRVASRMNKRSFDDQGRINEILMANLQAVNKGVAMNMATAELLSQKVYELLSAPPKPTDYTSLGNNAMELVSKIVLTFLNRPAAAPALSAANAPHQLPSTASSTAEPLAAPRPAQAIRPGQVPLLASPDQGAVAPLAPTAPTAPTPPSAAASGASTQATAPSEDPVLQALYTKLASLSPSELAQIEANPDFRQKLIDELNREHDAPPPKTPGKP